MKKMIKMWAAPLLCGLSVLLLFRYVFFVGYVPSVSMEPTIKAESCIFGCRLIGEIRRGDILVFERDGQMLVKRVMGIPGDVICLDGTRMGLVTEEYPSSVAQSLTVPEGCYFVQGDNAEHSIDSRVWDEPFVRQNQVVARVLVR